VVASSFSIAVLVRRDQWWPVTSVFQFLLEGISGGQSLQRCSAYIPMGSVVALNNRIIFVLALFPIKKMNLKREGLGCGTGSSD
jgi:hypothetical protein